MFILMLATSKRNISKFRESVHKINVGLVVSDCVFFLAFEHKLINLKNVLNVSFDLSMNAVLLLLSSGYFISLLNW